MPIQPGDPIPESHLQRIDEGVEIIDTPSLFDGKKVVLFAVPGAFTPTCSEKHLPGFIQHFDEFRAKGIEVARSEEHTSELQSLMRNSYAVFCLKKKNQNNNTTHSNSTNTTKHITKKNSS